MALLHATGFENQEVATFGEGDIWAGTAHSISTTEFYSGAASLRTNASTSTGYLARSFAANGNTTPVWATFRFKIATAPSGTTLIALFRDDTGTNQADIRVTASRTLQLFDTGAASPAQIGSDSSALTLDTWYRITLHTDNTGATATVTGYLDGVSFATGALNTSGANVQTDLFRLGIINTVTSADFYFDDLIINDNTGSFNTMPGDYKLAYLRPNAAGDTNNASSGDYTSVDDVTPDGGTTIAVLAGNNDILDVNVTSSTDAGIGSGDTIHAIAVGVNEAAASAAQESWVARIKSASGGTVVSSGTITHDDTTYKNNGDAAPRNYRLVSYTDPTTGVAWTATGTNSIDNMQIGIRAVDANPDINVSALWAIVIYEVAEAPEPGTITLDAISNGSSSDYADTTYTWNHTVSGDDTILIVSSGIWQDTTGTTTSVTYNGKALTEIRTDDNAGMNHSLWYIVAPDAGTNAIVVNMTGNGIQFIGEAISLNGVDQSDPIEADNGDATDNLKTADVSVTTITDNAWVVGGVLKFGTEVLTPHANTTETHETTLANVTGALGYREQPTAGATELEWTWITNDRDAAISAAAVKPAAASSASVKDIIGGGFIIFPRS